MSRRSALLIFWILGFAVGSIGYLSLPGVANWFAGIVPNFLNQAMIGALIAGIVGSAVSTFSIVTWANRSSTI
ncbi:MAG TPA: hypothetical protein VH796_16390 [Nitrososphaeraceae archaeon]|jgi:uncharacterized membrane protein YeaQ/YmgE (transglycosylase-associated protein family)